MVRSMLSESLQAVISQTLLKKKAEGVWPLTRSCSAPAIKNLIRKDKIAQMYSAIQTGQAIGMKTMDQSLQALRSTLFRLRWRGQRLAARRHFSLTVTPPLVEPSGQNNGCRLVINRMSGKISAMTLRQRVRLGLAAR